MLAVVIAVAVGCSTSPTAPSALSTAPVVAGQEAKPAPMTDIYVRLYFLCNKMDGMRRLTGMNVDLWWDGGPYTTDNPMILAVGQTGGVMFHIPGDVREFHWRTHDYVFGSGVNDVMCAEEGVTSIPHGAKGSWSHSITMSHNTSCHIGE
jgi:hypothetical protein